MIFQYFNNIKFNLDKKTGYYLSSCNLLNKRQERMHRYVWKFYNGEIPDGFHVHHINGNKSDNRIENLSLLKISDHMSIHSKEYIKKNKDKIVNKLKEINPLSILWHKSEIGKEWHKIHYQSMKNNLYEKFPLICLSCQIEFKNIKRTKFCSNKCKSQSRRDSMVDDIKKICGVCHNEYQSSKYSKSKTCSRKCGKLLHKNKIN